MITYYDIAGLLGVALAIIAYARVQWRRDYAKELGYSVLNLFNAVLLMISLSKNWNFAAFLGNAIWAVLSLYGIYRCIKYKAQSRRAYDSINDWDNRVRSTAP